MPQLSRDTGHFMLLSFLLYYYIKCLYRLEAQFIYTRVSKVLHHHAQNGGTFVNVLSKHLNALIG